MYGQLNKVNKIIDIPTSLKYKFKITEITWRYWEDSAAHLRTPTTQITDYFILQLESCLKMA